MSCVSRLLLSSLLVLALALPSWGAIAEVGTSNSSNGGTGLPTTLTVSHDAGSGANRITVVGISFRDISGGVTGISCTYNGVGMTSLIEHKHSSNVGPMAAIFYISDGATGTNDAVCNWTGTSRVAMGAVTYQATNGFDGPWRAGEDCEQVSGGTAVNVTISSAVGDLVFATFAQNNSSSSPTPDGSQNEQWENVSTSATAGNNVWSAGSDLPGAATVQSGWTWGGNQNGVVCAASLVEAAAAVGRRRASSVLVEGW